MQDRSRRADAGRSLSRGAPHRRRRHGAGLRGAARQHQQALRAQAACAPRSCPTPRRWRASARRRGRRRRSATRTSSRSKISPRCRRAPSIWRWSILDGLALADRMRQEPALVVRRGARHHAAGRLGPGRRARQGHRPPRHEAGEHLPGAEVRPPAGEDPRLRHRQGLGRRGQPLADAHRHHLRNAALHVAGAGAGQAARSAAPTSTRSASSCTSCSPARCRSKRRASWAS